VKHNCVPSPRTVDSFPAGDPRGVNNAEWAAGEQRAGGHPEAHVHYDAPTDAFAVVVNGGESR
jgi:hypothetical protein